MLQNISLYLDKYKEQLNSDVEEKIQISRIINSFCNFEPRNIKINTNKGFVSFEATPIERSFFLEKQNKIKEELENLLKAKIKKIG